MVSIKIDHKMSIEKAQKIVNNKRFYYPEVVSHALQILRRNKVCKEK